MARLLSNSQDEGRALFAWTIEPVCQNEQAEHHVQNDENVSRLHRIFLYQWLFNVNFEVRAAWRPR
jgi:hypothetical protein